MHRRSGKTTRVAAVLAVAVLAGLALAGCSGGQKSAQDATPSTSAKPAETGAAASAPATPPTLKLVAPQDGATVPAGDLTVNVEATGLKFSMPSNTNVAGEGHVHFTLDDRPFVMSITPDAVIEGVEPGTHTLEAELVQNSTESFDPPVREEIAFTAE